MLPVVKGPHETRRQIFAYAVLTALAGLAPAGLGLGGPVYGLVAAAMGAAFVWLAWALWRAPATSSTFAAEKRLFGYSILYLFALFAVLLIETLWSLYA
jgi:protoheme IX farnesyltransferase